MHPPRRQFDPAVLGLGIASLCVVGLLGVVALILLVRAPGQAGPIGSLFGAAGGLVGTIAGGLIAARFGKQAPPDPPEGGSVRLSVDSTGLRRVEVQRQIERLRRETPPPIPIHAGELEELERLDAAPIRIEERTIPGYARRDPTAPGAGEYSRGRSSGETLSYGEALAREAERGEAPARPRRSTGAQRIRRDE